MTKKQRRILDLRLEKRRKELDAWLPVPSQILGQGWVPPPPHSGVYDHPTFINNTVALISSYVEDAADVFIESGETDFSKIHADVLKEGLNRIHRMRDDARTKNEVALSWAAGIEDSILKKLDGLEQRIEIRVFEHRQKRGATELDRQIAWLKDRPLIAYTGIILMGYSIVFALWETGTKLYDRYGNETEERR